jgi:2-dehydropantoate 2-reductase
LNELKNIYLIGLGAIGSAYASRILSNCPAQFKVVVDAERTQRYKKSGITINGKAVDFDFVLAGAENEAADLIIIATKQHHLTQVIQDIRKLVGPNTIILSLLNGISSEEILGQEFGDDKLLHAFCVGTDAVRLGTDIKFENIGTIVFGDKNGSSPSQKVKLVKNFFDKAQIPYKIPDDIIREQWWKYMMNVGINQVSAVLRAPYRAFTVPGYARELMLDASKEVINIAQKLGISLGEDDLKAYLRILETISPDGKTSMLQDVEAGRKTEVEMFSGTVIQMGLKYGLPTPVNNMLYRILKAIEQIS